MPKQKFVVEVEVDKADSLNSNDHDLKSSPPAITGQLHLTAQILELGGFQESKVYRLDEDNTKVLSYDTMNSKTDEQTTLASSVEDDSLNDQQSDDPVSSLEAFCDALEVESNVAYSIKDDEITFKGGGTDKDRYVDAIGVFFDHEYISVEDLPYQTPQASDRYLLNTEPIHQTGREMKGPAQPIPGVYVPTWRSLKEKKTALRQLIYEFVDTDE